MGSHITSLVSYCTMENIGEFSYIRRLFGGEKFGEWPNNGKRLSKFEGVNLGNLPITCQCFPLNSTYKNKDVPWLL